MMQDINQCSHLPTLDRVIDRNPLTVTPDAYVVDALSLMSQAQNSDNELSNLNCQANSSKPNQQHRSCILVVSGEQLLGILTERDVVNLTAELSDVSRVTVAEVMTQQVITLTKSDKQNALTALLFLRQHRIRHLPILNEQGKLLGIVTLNSIRQALHPANLLKMCRVAEVMSTHTINAPTTASVLSLVKLMASNKVSCIVIVDDSQLTATPQLLTVNRQLTPVGIITERDIVQFQARGLDLEKTEAGSVMSTPLFCLSPADSLWVAHQEMEAQGVRRLIVTGEQGEFLGIITQTDLLQMLDPVEMVGVIAALQQKVETQTAELKQVNQQLQQEIAFRLQVEETLRQSYLELENRVKQRTSELVQANELLQSEIQIRKQAEDKICEQAALLDNATDAIFLRELNGNILYWNKGAETLYGWQAAEAIGKNAGELLYKETSQLEAALKTTVESGLWRGELSKVRKDGKYILVESRWTLMRDEAGNPKSILTVDTDITEKKQLEAQFLRTQRLESLGTLASGIVHDFNNILTPILAAAQILTLKLSNLDEQSKFLLQIVEDSSKRGSNLVQQILSFARGAEGKRSVVQVENILAEVVRVTRQTFPKSIEVSLDSSTKNLWAVFADTTQLHQVFMNLAVNARDAMSEGGKLTFFADNIYVDESYALIHPDARVGPYLAIAVRDTGCGIKREILERIFEPFFTTKEENKGTGLGLPTVLGIIKSHGGFVSVYSEVGKGTRFKVYLPAVQETATQPTKDLELLTGNGELILVVDDEASVKEITKASLESYNYKALTAGDGVEAIVLFAQNKNKISVVLLDLMMPALDSPTTIRTLKKIKPDIKIITMSGLASNEAIVRTSGASTDAFLLKPFTSQELLRTLYRVIRGESNL